jgi:hypothetical protein
MRCPDIAGEMDYLKKSSGQIDVCESQNLKISLATITNRHQCHADSIPYHSVRTPGLNTDRSSVFNFFGNRRTRAPEPTFRSHGRELYTSGEIAAACQAQRVVDVTRRLHSEPRLLVELILRQQSFRGFARSAALLTCSHS